MPHGKIFLKWVPIPFPKLSMRELVSLSIPKMLAMVVSWGCVALISPVRFVPAPVGGLRGLGANGQP